MQYELIFKRIILITLFSWVIIIGLTLFPNLTEPNPEYVMINDGQPFFINILTYPLNYIFGTIFALAILINLLSLYFLYKFKSYGRKIYIYSYVVALVLSFLTTGFYYTGLEETIEWINSPSRLSGQKEDLKLLRGEKGATQKFCQEIIKLLTIKKLLK